ncbi:MAG: uroporphyrinogen decarboxylase family protein [bacterium]
MNKMSEMSKNERLCAAFKCQPVDRIPISIFGLTPYNWMKDSTDPGYKRALVTVEKYCDHMVKWWISHGILFGASCDGGFKEESSASGDIVTIKKSLSTPLGDLTSISKLNKSVSRSPATVKHFVENLEDAEKLLRIRTKPYRPDLTEYFEVKSRLGYDGLMYYCALCSPIDAISSFFNYEYYLEFCFLYPDLLTELAEKTFVNLKDYANYILDSGVKDVIRWMNIEPFTEPMMPPEFIKEHIVPYDKQIVKLFHEGGALVMNHCHGRLKNQLNNFLEIGVDGIDCVEPPPANDCDLNSMKSITDNRLSFWGYIQWEDLERQSPERIAELTREAVKMGGDTGFILSQCASTHTQFLTDKFAQNLVTMIETGWECINKKVHS